MTHHLNMYLTLSITIAKPALCGDSEQKIPFANDCVIKVRLWSYLGNTFYEVWARFFLSNASSFRMHFPPKIPCLILFNLQRPSGWIFERQTLAHTYALHTHTHMSNCTYLFLCHKMCPRRVTLGWRTQLLVLNMVWQVLFRRKFLFHAHKTTQQTTLFTHIKQ